MMSHYTPFHSHKAAGIHIDDCWAMDERNAAGQLYPDPTRFPNGLTSLFSTLHSMNFSVTLYTSLGFTTCEKGGRSQPIPGSFGYYQQDAETFQSWGVDIMKGDWCGAGNLNITNVTVAMGEILASLPTPMGFNFHCMGT
jgi:alpha-galactosidase